MDSSGPTASLADFVVNASYEDVPKFALELGKRRILDTLGVTLAGSKEPAPQIVYDFVIEAGGKPEATILGRSSKANEQDAAFVNGTAAHALDFDDAIPGSSLMGHPSATILPTALAVGEAISPGASGKDVLLAYLVGLEVLGAIGDLVNPSHYDMGFHSTSTIGSIGVACAAGKLMGLDNDDMVRALGISASMSSGLRGNFGTMTKPLHAGLAARNGITAAALAKKGFTSAPNIFETENGFFETMSKNPKPALHVGDYGYVRDITVKPYPSCAATHAIIDSVIALSEKHSLEAQDVSSMEIEVSSLNTNVLRYTIAQTGLEGKFSAQFCAAIALIRHSVGIRDFGPTTVADGSVKKLEARIELKANDKLFSHGSMGAAVTIQTPAGSKYRSENLEPLGSPRNPMSDGQIEAKYKDCVAGVLKDEQIERSSRAILAIEELPNIKELTRVLIPD